MAKGKKTDKKNKKAALFDSDDDEKFDLKNASGQAADEDAPVPQSPAKAPAKQKSKSKAKQELLEQEVQEEEEEDLKPKSKSAAKSEKRKPTASFDALAVQDEEEEEEKPVASGKKEKKESKKKKAASSFDVLMMDNEEQDAGNAEESEMKEDVSGSLAELSLDTGAKKKKKSAFRKEAKKAAKELASSSAASPVPGDESDASQNEPAEQLPAGHFSKNSDHITATGILLSHERSKDVQIDKFSLAAYGQQLVTDTSLHLVYGRKYGLVGSNGCGKSTLLRCLAHRHIPIQNNVELYLLEREYDPTDLTAVQAVVDIVEQERNKLEEEQDKLLETIEGAESIRFEHIQERLQELDLAVAEQKARSVLAGLGFTEEMQNQKTREFSGGWRMRVALARALFVKPTCLLLDDATNHLDLSAVVWLEDYLQTYPHTIVMVSHSQDLLNSVCTDILYMNPVRRLEEFSGNYDTFVKVKAELDENARKRYKADEKKLQKIKENLSRTGAQAKQAKSHQKALQKRMDSKKGDEDTNNAIDPSILHGQRKLEFHFQECGGGLPSPFLKFNDVSFHYPGRPLIYRGLNFGIDLESRVALVGPNGAGKSTLMKLMCGDLEPTSGTVYRHHHLRVAKFHQHLTEQLNMSMSAVEWMCVQFPEIKFQEMRGFVGKFGITGKSQVIPMEQLSDGQRRRVVFSWLAKMNCHLLLLDEPTNFLDPETIDALAEGIRQFDGGVVLISHDFRLIDQVAEEIWVVEDGTVDEWEGDIREYKEHLKEKVRVAEH